MCAIKSTRTAPRKGKSASLRMGRMPLSQMSRPLRHEIKEDLDLSSPGVDQPVLVPRRGNDR